jgi:hypothetical protein
LPIKAFSLDVYEGETPKKLILFLTLKTAYMAYALM